MQAGQDRKGATGEKENCSTIYSQNKHIQEPSLALNVKKIVNWLIEDSKLKSQMKIKAFVKCIRYLASGLSVTMQNLLIDPQLNKTLAIGTKRELQNVTHWSKNILFKQKEHHNT